MTTDAVTTSISNERALAAAIRTAVRDAARPDPSVIERIADALGMPFDSATKMLWSAPRWDLALAVKVADAVPLRLSVVLEEDGGVAH